MNMFDELSAIHDAHVDASPLEVGLRCLVYIEGKVGAVMCEEARVELCQLIEVYVDAKVSTMTAMDFDVWSRDVKCVGDLLYTYVHSGAGLFFREAIEHARARGLLAG